MSRPMFEPDHVTRLKNVFQSLLLNSVLKKQNSVLGYIFIYFALAMILAALLLNITNKFSYCKSHSLKST